MVNSAVITSPSADNTESKLSSPPPGAKIVLLLSVFVIAVCGLIYELIFGALSSYLLGNSVTQFSIVIGLFLTAMGVGSFLSKFVTTNLLRTFLLVEIFIGLLGGSSALLLFFSFALLSTYLPLLVLISLVVGALVGIEIPLLVRILRQQASLRDALGNVLALDYLGALAASLLFPLLLLPRLGLVRTSFFFGLLNVTVSLIGLRFFRGLIPRARALQLWGGIAVILLLVGFLSAGRATSLLEDTLYEDEIIFAKTTPYQRIIITRWRDDLRLYLDGNIQFSSVDEHRYHEALVHPVMGLHPAPRQVLLLGAGDGMAAREVLKHKTVQRVVLVDLDPEMTRLFRTQPILTRLNAHALQDNRVQIVNQDAQKFLERTQDFYDVVIIDLPDPNNEGLGKLYTRSFYRLLSKRLTPRGLFVTQATSPFYATDAFWCIVNTIADTTDKARHTRLVALPYLASVPSFGVWGFVLASHRPLRPSAMRLTVPTRYLNRDLIPSLFTFPADIGPRPTPINRLDNQVLIKLYEQGYRRYNK